MFHTGTFNRYILCTYTSLVANINIMSERHIIHADLDAFYAAVEQLDNPELLNLPVLVGGRPEKRGVVATASYEARKYGVHSAMPMSTAQRLCPDAIIMPPRFDRYRELSKRVMQIFSELTPLVEPMSLDEAYLDITDPVHQGHKALQIGIDLKNKIKGDTGLVISIGIGTTKSISKIASDLGKPDGLVIVSPGNEADFLSPLPVGHIPGIGPKTMDRLKGDGINTIGQLAAQEHYWFLNQFGKRGLDIRAKAQGKDDDAVHTTRSTKSISAETTFSEDIDNFEHLKLDLFRLVDKVANQLEFKTLSCKTVTVKIRLSDFTTFTRQSTFSLPTRSKEELRDSALILLKKESLPERSFRLLGFGASNFKAEELNRSLTQQLSLF